MKEFADEYIEFKQYKTKRRSITTMETKRLRRIIKSKVKKGESYVEIKNYIESIVDYEKTLLTSEIYNDRRKQELNRINDERRRFAQYEKAKICLKEIENDIVSLESDYKNIEKHLKKSPLHYGRLVTIREEDAKEDPDDEDENEI